ncbi:hypothetical protein Desaci_0307 [Desulfosporosinus acidiphilus SJ4]|uniref:Uncharacterized protein n=1 Tax=Desulfosporosinus acidiphilus (strain DSM 22704 / JCM 16185 / SJ4) TaxID=646529 RepID=I4D0Q5_DESAJ|nr:hypothetical protein Desaci_0307 [Desulfosporosinus acidiphilus SJ4]
MYRDLSFLLNHHIRAYIFRQKAAAKLTIDLSEIKLIYPGRIKSEIALIASPFAMNFQLSPLPKSTF